MARTAWFLFVLFTLSLTPLAQAEPLFPVDVRVVEIGPQDSVIVPVELDANLTALPRFVLLVAGGLVKSGPVEVALRSGEALVSSWEWANASAPLDARRFVVERPSGNVTLTFHNPASSNATVFVYYDAPCACPSKTPPFPGAWVVLNQTLARGEGVVLDVFANGTLTIDYEVATLVQEDGVWGVRSFLKHSVDALPNGSLAWTATEDGDAFLFVEALSGQGDVTPVFVVTPAPPKDRMPFLTPGIILAFAAVVALSRRGQLGR